jgi:hypothetical protein
LVFGGGLGKVGRHSMTPFSRQLEDALEGALANNPRQKYNLHGIRYFFPGLEARDVDD